MAEGRTEGGSRLRSAAWLLLILTAALAVYFGLSSALLPFIGAEGLYAGVERWIVLASGLLQLAAAAAAVRAIARRDMRGAVLALAAWHMLNWLGLAPALLRDGLLRDGLGAGLDGLWPLALPVIAAAAAALAWRNRHPLLAAFVVTAPTTAGLAFTVVFGVMIAVRGF